MEKVQKYDCLYDKNSRDYKDKYKKMNAWTKVVELFKMTTEEAEKMFKNSRTAYGRYLERVKSIPCGSAIPATGLQAEKRIFSQGYVDHCDSTALACEATGGSQMVWVIRDLALPWCHAMLRAGGGKISGHVTSNTSRAANRNGRVQYVLISA